MLQADSFPRLVTYDLGEHDFAMIAVEQQGVDIEMIDQGGPCMASRWSVDLRQTTTATEYLPVATQPGRRVGEFVVRSVASEPVSGGRLVLRIDESRSSRDSVAECRGWRAFLDARVAALDRSPEAQKRAILHYQRSVDLFRSLDAESGLGQALVNQATTEHRLGLLNEALDHLSEARRRLSSIDSAKTTLYDANSETAVILDRLGRYEVAKFFFGEALNLAQELGDGHRISKALNGLGLVHKRLEQWPQAIGYYSRALDLAKGHRCREAAARINLGTAYARLGEYQSALEHSTAAVELASGTQASGSEEDELPCRLASAALNALGMVYTSLARWRIAAASFEEALAVSDSSGRLRILINLGRALQRSGEYLRARDVFREAIQLAAEQNDPNAQFSAWTNLGYLTLHRFQDPEGARRHYESAKRFVRAERSQEAARLLVLGSELDLMVGAPNAAAEQALAALKLAESLEHEIQQAGALQALAQSRLAQNRPADAAEAAERAAEIVEGYRLHTADPDLRASFLSSRLQYFELWIRALQALYRVENDPQWLEKSLEVAERGRARALLDMLDTASIEGSQQVDPTLMRLEAELESLYLRHRRQAEWDPQQTGPDADQERTEREETEHALSIVQARILERRSILQTSQSKWTRLRSIETLDAREMRDEVVDEETALLYFFVGEATAWRWLATPSGLSAAEIPSRAELDARIRALLQAVAEPARDLPGEDLDARRARIARSRETFEGLSSNLARDVLGSVVDQLRHEGIRRVVVVPDGPLAYLPFGALPAFSKSTPLVLEFEWSQLPSVSVLASLRKGAHAARSSSQALAVLADPVFSTNDPRLQAGTAATTRRALEGRDFRRLPGTAAEALALSELVTGDALIATGFDATAELAMSGRLSQYRMIHFATHGIVDTEYPELSALVLSRVDSEGRPLDGFLRLSDIYRLQLNADLVVLSACQTALGQELRGEGLIGLTRGFLYAGASSVVASLWTVEDQATRKLMGLMYKHHLHDDLPVTSALHLAQREMALDPRYSPFHWAGFVLQGDFR